LLHYFVTVDLVTSPKITASLRRFIISIFASHCVRHRRLQSNQNGTNKRMSIRAQAVRLFEKKI